MKTSDFERAPDNQGALLNTNNAALEQYKRTKKRMGKIDELETRLNRIEDLLLKLVENK